MTAQEKQEIIDEVISAIKSDSHSLSPLSLDVVNTVTGVNSLPALKGAQLVLVPLSLLSGGAEAAAAAALSAAGQAADATQQAQAAVAQLANYVNNGGYDAPNNRMVFFAGNNSVLFSVDMSPFTVDGHVDNVTFANGNLTITFNQDAHKSPIVVPLTSLFDASLYYTKLEVQQLVTDATYFGYDDEEEALIFGDEPPGVTTTTTTTIPPGS